MEESERDHASADMNSYGLNSAEEQEEQDLQRASRGQQSGKPGQQEEEEEEEEVYGGDYEEEEEEEQEEKEAHTIDSEDARDEDYSDEPKDQEQERSDSRDKEVGKGPDTEDTYSDDDTSSSYESQEEVGQSVDQRHTQAEDNLSTVEYVEAHTSGDGRNVKPGSKRAGHPAMNSSRYEHSKHQLHPDMNSPRYPHLSQQKFAVAENTLPYIRRKEEKDVRETQMVNRAQATRAMPTRPKTIPSRWQRPISSTAPWGRRVLGWRELSLAADQEREAVMTRRLEAQQHYSLQGRRGGLRWARHKRHSEEQTKRDESEHRKWLKLKRKTQLDKQHEKDNQLRAKLLAYFADEAAIRDTLSSRQPADQPTEPRVEPHVPETQEPRSPSISAVQDLYARISSRQSPALQRAIHHYSQSTVASIEEMEAQRLDSSRPSTAEYRKSYRLWTAPSSQGITQSRRNHALLSRELHNTVFRAAQPSGVHQIMEAMSQRVTQHTPRQALGETAVSMDATDKMDANDVMDAMNAAEGLGHAISEDDKDQHVHSTTPHRTQNSSKLQLGSRKDLEELRSLKRRKRLQGTRGKGSQVRSPRRGKRTGVAMAAAFQGFVVDWDTVVRGWSERGAVQLQEVLGQIADGEEEAQSNRDGSPVSGHRVLQAQWCFHTLCGELQMGERHMDVLRLTLPLTPGIQPSRADYRQLLLYVSVLLRARQRLVQVLEAIEQREGYVRAVNACQTREGLGDRLLGFQKASTLCLHAIQALWSAAPWLEQAFLYQNVDYEQKVWHELRILEAHSKSAPGRGAGVREEEGN